MSNPFDGLKKADEAYEQTRYKAYEDGLVYAQKYNQVVTQLLKSYADYLEIECSIEKSQIPYNIFLDRSEPKTNHPIIYYWSLKSKSNKPQVELSITLQYRFTRFFGPREFSVLPNTHFLLVNMLDKEGKFWNLYNTVSLQKEHHKGWYYEGDEEIFYSNLEIEDIVEKVLLREIMQLHSRRFPKV